MTLNAALLISGLLVVIVLAIPGYFGALYPIAIEDSELGPILFVYRETMGTNMRQIRTITTDLDRVLVKAGIETRDPLDVFYPDGRTEVGFAVEGAEDEQLALLEGQALVRQIPAGRFMTVRFPWRGPLSFVVGYFKVNPALARYRTAHGYRKVEALALNRGDSILYRQPVVKA